MPSGPGAQQAAVLGVRDQQGAAGVVHLAGRGVRLGVDTRHGPGQLRGPLVLRADDELPPQLPLPFHVDDDPGGELAGQQPGAALQHDGLADRGVL